MAMQAHKPPKRRNKGAPDVVDRSWDHYGPNIDRNRISIISCFTRTKDQFRTEIPKKERK